MSKTLQEREKFYKLLSFMQNDVQELQDRARQAEKIAKNPQKYKVCVCCDSIVTAKVVICPNCHGYRFDGDPLNVASQARILGSREQHSVLASDLQ